jgi:hypothetical protein
MSFFMFVERDDWNWSPLNSFGKIRPARYTAYRKLCGVLGALAPDAALADVGLLWSLREQRRHMAAGTDGWEDLFKHWMLLDEPKESATWWRTFTRLHDTDTDFVLVDDRDDVDGWPEVIVYAGGTAPDGEEIARLEQALRAGRTLVCAGRLTAQQQTRLAGAGQVIAAAPRDVPDAAAGAGARRYVRASEGLWSFAYEDLDEPVMTVFLVNTTPEPRTAELEGELADQSFMWRELVSGRTGSGTLRAAVEDLGSLVPSNDAYVLRLERR